MKILQTEITSTLNNYISVLERQDAYFKSPFHFHPELELVYIKEGFGKRIIGNKIEPFNEGDMVFVGSNLPHVWMNDESFYKNNSSLKAKSTVAYFNRELFAGALFQLKEASIIKELFKKAERGISVQGETKDKIIQKLEQLPQKHGFDRIIVLFEILNILSKSDDILFINSNVFDTSLHKTDADRLSEVFRHVKENFHEDITLNTVARLANMTPQSFCRLFKKRTNKHFIEYLNEVRIEHACKFLLEKDWCISEVAYACGYKTVSNFNKLFKEALHTSPKLYKLSAQQNNPAD